MRAMAGEGGLVVSSNSSSPATPPPTRGFQSFPFVLVRQLQTLPNLTVQCAHGATTSTALLAQCLASQCPPFSTPASCADHNALKVTNPVTNASLACSLQAKKENRHEPIVQAKKLSSPNHTDSENTAKCSLSGATNRGNSKEKSPSSSFPVVAANGGSGNGNTGKWGGGGLVASSNTRSSAMPMPIGGFQSYPSVMLRRLQALPPSQNIQCSHGATTNTTLLLQFLASQYPEFSTPGAALPTPAPCGDHKVTNPVSNASPACNLQAQKENRPNPGMQATNLGSPNHPDGANNATNNGNSKEKSSSCSHSSEIMRTPLAPQSRVAEGVDHELLNGGSDLVFTVQRRGKTRGVGARQLKMSDVRAYFHLSVANAAKKLRVSLSTLKNACRKFGLERWPGRKVRSLQSTIGGLKHAIDVGQRVGLKELNEAYMLSEICNLQQEMHQLVHGTPAQVTQKMHSPAGRTAYLYKRLYSRGWRSKYHSAGRHDMFPLARHRQHQQRSLRTYTANHPQIQKNGQRESATLPLIDSKVTGKEMKLQLDPETASIRWQPPVRTGSPKDNEWSEKEQDRSGVSIVEGTHQGGWVNEILSDRSN